MPWGLGVALRFGANLVELDILDEELGLGRFVYPYEVPYASGTRAERAVQRERVFERFRDAGWITRTGSLRADVEELLRLWARPEVLITQVATVMEDGARFLYRGGWSGKFGVFSDQEGDVVTVSELRAGQVIPELVGILPDWEPLSAAPVSYISPGERGRDDEVFSSINGSVTDSSGRRRAAERFFAAPILRAGVISCSIREPGTGTRRGREVDMGSLTWFDSADGRFFTTTETLPDRARRHTFTRPTTPASPTGYATASTGNCPATDRVEAVTLRYIARYRSVEGSPDGGGQSMTDNATDGAIAGDIANVFGGEAKLKTMGDDAKRMLADAQAGKWAVDEETGTHLRRAITQMQDRLSEIGRNVFQLQRAPMLGNDAYAQTVAQHFLAAMDSDDQSLVKVFSAATDNLDTLRQAIETAISKYNASDEAATQRLGAFKD
jgi:hypothetical protein